jgi:hypothetical protein
VSWAAPYIAALKRGETVQFRPKGSSMTGRIESGQLVTVEPLGLRMPEVGEAVLCKVKGKDYVHLVKAEVGGRYQIGNNRGRINGWVGIAGIYGRVTEVAP